MKILFTGRGTSGSWKVRGEQLSYAIGADAIPKASAKQMEEYDLVVLVKRPAPDQIENLNKIGIPWIWDVVDFYPQPVISKWDKDRSIKWVKKQVQKADPSAVIWATNKMMLDCGDPKRDFVLYHHHRPGINENPIRETVKVVGYEGSEKYLSDWGNVIRKACKSRGIKFVVNSGSHKDWDICVAFRGNGFKGYAQRHWKSNVKLANAHGSGTPIICDFESGYQETAEGSELFCTRKEDFGSCLDSLSDPLYRKRISDLFLKQKYTVNEAAKNLITFIKRSEFVES